MKDETGVERMVRLGGDAVLQLERLLEQAEAAGTVWMDRAQQAGWTEDDSGDTLASLRTELVSLRASLNGYANDDFSDLKPELVDAPNGAVS